MEALIQSTIENYVKSLSLQDVPQLDALLHPEFRVTQVSSDEFKTTIINKELYLNLVVAGKVGGDVYIIENLSIQYVGSTAMASYTLNGQQTNMHVFLHLVQSGLQEWKILSNTPVVTVCRH